MQFRTAFCARVLSAVAMFIIATPSPATAEDTWFETDPINPGLSAPPREADRETPRATMESLLRYLRQQEFDHAAHLLDLSDLPQSEQRARGAELARQLGVVLERQVLIPWNTLADRPDGWLIGGEKEPGTGRARRSILLSLLDLGEHPIPLRINRVKPPDEPAVWLISRNSVTDIPLLYERFKPTRLEETMPGWARQRSAFDMYVWEILLMPLIAALALGLGALTHWVVGKLGQVSDRRLVRTIVRAFRWPATIIMVSAVLGFATSRLLVVTGPVSTITGPLVLLGYVVGFALAAILVADEIFERVSLSSPHKLADPDNQHYRNMATMISGFRKFVIIIAVLVGTGTVLSSIAVFNSLGFTLLAGAGALTIVIGFAAREVLGNILAAVQIALNRSARIGDQIIFEGRFCTVERIHFTYVQLLIWNGNRFIVPISHFVSHDFENWSIGDSEMIRPIELTLAQHADVAMLRDEFHKLMDEIDDGTLGPRDKAHVRVTGQDVFGLKVRFELPTTDPSTFWELECMAREKLVARAAMLEEKTGKPVLPPMAPPDLPET